MSKALLRRAEYIRSNLGDHGDPYEDSLIKGEVSVELKIMVKEIFDHLRSSLDYCARKVVSSYLRDTQEKKVYFPIVSRTSSQEDFRGIIGKALPNVVTENPELIPVFASFQPFTSQKNNWIADFATLCNQNKHEHLSIINCLATEVIYRTNEKGETVFTYSNYDKVLFKETPLMLITNYPEGGEGQCYHHYIIFEEIRVELLTFLDDCIKGVYSIINKLESIKI